LHLVPLTAEAQRRQRNHQGGCGAGRGLFSNLLGRPEQALVTTRTDEELDRQV